MKYPNNNSNEKVNEKGSMGDGAQDPAMREAITALAYGLSKQRDASTGSPLDDWLQAEQMVREHIQPS